MKNRKWTHKQKLEIVLEGLNGRVTIRDLCNRHQIQQTQYYEWKKHRLPAFIARVSDTGTV